MAPTADPHDVAPGHGRRVFLVGLMGSGKTTIGRLLAKLLGLPFVDSDVEIERLCGADIAWIFDAEGEQGFRRREELALDTLTRGPSVVLATGGGAVLRETNRRHLEARGVVIYLRVPVAELARRISGSSDRPLVQGRDPAVVLQDLQDQRESLYREVADLIVEPNGRSPRQMARYLKSQLKELLP